MIKIKLKLLALFCSLTFINIGEAQIKLSQDSVKKLNELILGDGSNDSKDYLSDSMEYRNLEFDLNRTGFTINLEDEQGIFCSFDYIRYKFINEKGEVELSRFTKTGKLLQKGKLFPVGPFKKSETGSTTDDYGKEILITRNVNTFYLEKKGPWEYYDTLTNKIIKTINHTPLKNPQKLQEKRVKAVKERCNEYRRMKKKNGTYKEE